MEAYLDNSATTRCLEEAADLVRKVLCEDYGNPSSMHMKGVQSEYYVRNAKEVFAKILKAQPKEIFFTSGGTESDNWAIIGSVAANLRRGKHIITTKIEHPAILETMKYLENQGFDVTYLGVDRHGIVSIEQLKEALRPDTILVSVMHTNNEIGSVQPLEEIGRLIKAYNPRILFHVDAVQGFGKFQIHPKKLNIDMLSVSGHKIHGPKGVGILYVGEKVKIHPFILGGGQQKGMRSGTENVPGYAGIAKAAEILYKNLDEDVERLYELKQYFIDEVTKIEGVTVNSLAGKDSAPHIVSVSVRGVRSEVLLHALEEKEIYISAGSACASNHPQTSETLKAIGLEKELLSSTIRFSFSIFTTKEELDYTLQTMCDMIPMLRRYSRH